MKEITFPFLIKGKTNLPVSLLNCSKMNQFYF